jgi:ABC-type multidrug transport system permease subunit
MNLELTLPAGTQRTQRPLGTGAALRAIGNEVYKGLLAGWGERLQILIELPLFVIFGLLVAAIVGRGEDIVSGEIDWSVDPSQATWILLGYVAFAFYYLQTAKLFWRLLGEIQTGTLEQVYLSPLPSWLIAAAGRVVAAVIETTVVVAAVAVAAAIVLQPSVTWRVDALVPLAFLVAGGTGYSLILGGLALVWKRTEMINDAMAGILMMFGGLLVPLTQEPGWMASIGRLVPVSHAAESMRRVLLNGQSPFALGGDGGLAWLAGTTLAWLLAGVLMFAFGERIAKKKGSLSHY